MRAANFLIGGLVAFVLGLTVASVAQQPPPDPALATCKDLLGEANGRVITLGAQAARLAAEVKAAQDELAKLKEAKPPEPKP